MKSYKSYSEQLISFTCFGFRPLLTFSTCIESVNFKFFYEVCATAFDVDHSSTSHILHTGILRIEGFERQPVSA